MKKLIVAALVLGALQSGAQELPARLSDSTFWKLITDFSEPGGYFRSDNFVSNEMAFQYVIPALQATTKPGGVYLGVGPDQNFTYIVGIKPKLSFIFDIRRGNLEEHLLYKAIIEMSDNRADFLSRLFSRHLPERLTRVRRNSPRASPTARSGSSSSISRNPAAISALTTSSRTRWRFST